MQPHALPQHGCHAVSPRNRSGLHGNSAAPHMPYGCRYMDRTQETKPTWSQGVKAERGQTIPCQLPVSSAQPCRQTFPHPCCIGLDSSAFGAEQVPGIPPSCPVSTNGDFASFSGSLPGGGGPTPPHHPLCWGNSWNSPGVLSRSASLQTTTSLAP